MFSIQENKYLIRSHPLCLSMHYEPVPPDYHNKGPHNGGEYPIKTHFFKHREISVKDKSFSTTKN